jgi:histone acetyltransferase 1
MIKRIEVLVPLFIEGGSLLELDEPDELLERWTVFFLYEKSNVSDDPAQPISPYTFVGYSTLYRFYYYQKRLSSDSPTQIDGVDFNSANPGYSFATQPCRSRISQFVILPPFHRGGK